MDRYPELVKNKNWQVVFVQAAQYGYVNWVKYYFPQVESRFLNGKALINAIVWGHLEIVQFLVNSGITLESYQLRNDLSRYSVPGNIESVPIFNFLISQVQNPSISFRRDYYKSLGRIFFRNASKGNCIPMITTLLTWDNLNPIGEFLLESEDPQIWELILKYARDRKISPSPGDWITKLIDKDDVEIFQIVEKYGFHNLFNENYGENIRDYLQ